MSVAGFLAARGGPVSGSHLGGPSWLPALTAEVTALGRSLSYRGGATLAAGASESHTCYAPGALPTDDKLMTVVYIVGHQSGTVDESLKGIVLVYFSIASDGTLVVDGVDITFLTNTLGGAVPGVVTGLVAGGEFTVEVTNSSGAGSGILGYAIWMTTFKLDVGTITP